MNNVIIVGGGMTGLSAAFYLERLAARAGVALDVSVLEADARAGGKVLTHRQDGFVLEAGPDGFVPHKPAAIELVRDLGIEDRLLASNDESRGLAFVKDGRLLTWPAGMGMLVPRRLGPLIGEPLLSWRGKLRLFAERFVPPRRSEDDESVGDFVRRRCGREMLERVAEPLLSSLHVGDIDLMSLESSCPQLRALEQRFGSLTRAALERPDTGGSGGPVFMSLENGMADLTDTLAERLGSRVRTGTGVRAAHVPHVTKPGDRAVVVETLDGDRLEADALVLATPALVSSRIIRGSLPDLSSALDRFETASIAVLSMAYRKRDVPPLEGFGFFAPRREGLSILGGTWTSTKFRARAPSDHVLIRLFVGGAHGEHLFAQEDGAIFDRVIRDLANVTGLAAEPTRVRIDRWASGYPQYRVGHRQAVMALEAACPPSLLLAGSAFFGVGLPDCITSGKAVAKRLVAAFAEGSVRPAAAASRSGRSG